MAIRTENVGVQALMAQAQSRLTNSTTTTTTSTTGTGTESTAAEKIKRLSPELSQAHERIAAQAQAASTSLSALGQFKSSLVDLGQAGKDLVALSSTATTQAVQSAVEKFVSLHNASVAKGTAAAGSATDSSVGRTMRDLRSAVSGAATDTGIGTDQPTLTKLGLTQQPDGTLVLDAKALAKSLETNAAGTTAALARVGKAVSSSASTALDGDSRLNTSITSIGNRAKQLQLQETAVVDTATRLSEAYGTSITWNRQVLDAYFKN